MKLRNKKTGVIGELSGVNRIVVYEPDMPLCGNSILGEYDTLAELNKDWEDYKPVEPLIKDEKIRKAVRAWAEVNDFEPDCKVRYGANSYSLFSSEASIEFNIRIKGLEHLKDYTITELCGEEEE